MSGRKIYEVRVDLVDGYEIARLECATIDEALQRASRIWSNPLSVTLLGTVDLTPPTCLAGYSVKA